MISVKTVGVAQATKRLRETKTTIDKAEKRAVRKTAAFAKSIIARVVAKQLQVPAFSVKARVSTHDRTTDLGGFKVWGGLRNLPARRLVRDAKSLKRFIDKRPRKGVRLGKYFWQSSFVAPIGKGDKYDVFMRNGGRMRSKNKESIERINIDVSEQLIPAFKRAEPQISERLSKTLAQELNFALNVEK